MDESLCPICGDVVPTPLLKLHIQLEKSLIREMREANPEWFDGNRICAKCIDEYKRKHQRIREEAREIRAKAESLVEEFNFDNPDIDTEDDN